MDIVSVSLVGVCACVCFIYPSECTVTVELETLPGVSGTSVRPQTVAMLAALKSVNLRPEPATDCPDEQRVLVQGFTLIYCLYMCYLYTRYISWVVWKEM